MAYRIGVVLALVGLVGCQTQFDTDSKQSPIIGGDVFTSEFSAVCAMEIVLPPDPDDPMKVRDNLWCNCVLVAPQILLTAASCVEENLTADTLNDVDIRFGDDYQGSAQPAVITEAVLHRYYDPELTGRNDLALLVIDNDYGITPAVLNERALTDTDLGTTVTLVGSGETDSGTEDYGQRNKAQVNLDIVDDNHIQAGTDEITTCRGDSGGPGFMDLGGGNVVVSINARISNCFANARRTRVDRYLTDFIHPFIDRNVGACAADGSCVTTGCRTPDPDCDTCAWQGSQPPPETPTADCQEDCPTRDWDCPLKTFLGGVCDINGDCEEFGSCIAATDEADYTYCTRSCDPAGGDAQCPSPVVGAEMTCVDLGGGVGQCEYGTPSPGAQGFACGDDNSVCTSGICEETICVNECDPGAADACPGEFTCGPSTVSPGTNVCLGAVKSGGGGFCAIAPAGAKKKAVAPTLFGLLLLGGVMFGLVWVTRRRRNS